MVDNNGAGAVQAAGLEIFPVEIVCGDCQVRTDKGDPGLHLFAAQQQLLCDCYYIYMYFDG